MLHYASTPHTPPEPFKKHQKYNLSKHVADYYAMCEWFDEACRLNLNTSKIKVVRQYSHCLCQDNGWIQNPEKNIGMHLPKNNFHEGGTCTNFFSWPNKLKPQDLSSLNFVQVLIFSQRSSWKGCGCSYAKEPSWFRPQNPAMIKQRTP